MGNSYASSSTFQISGISFTNGMMVLGGRANPNNWAVYK